MKKKKYVRFLTMNGSKFRFLDLINQRINNLLEHVNVYIEPFAGTFNVFLNLQRDFDKYIINDKNDRIVHIAKTVRDCEFDDYMNFWKEHFNELNISKEKYYDIRNRLNKLYFNTNSKEEGLFYLIIHNFCINGFLRFGKNGLNQSGGKKSNSLKFTESDFYLIKNRFKKSNLLSLDYKETIKHNSKNSFYFLDPPYIVNNTTNYINNGFLNRNEFYSFVKEINYFLYTNME